MASFIPVAAKKAITDAWYTEAYPNKGYICLLTTSFDPTAKTYAVYADLTNEVVGTGYTAGGAVLQGIASTTTGSTAKFTASVNTQWTSATLSNIHYAVWYVNENTKPIRAIFELPSTYSVVNGTFSLLWNTAGLVNVL